ncbi:MAG: hypothetical protein ABJC09_02315 [Terriglobia bacterium]
MPNGAPPLTIGFRQHRLFEAAKRGIEAIEGHLHGVEGKTVGEYSEVNRGVSVAGEADEAHFPLPFRFRLRLRRAARSEDQAGIVVVNNFVNLPDIWTASKTKPVPSIFRCIAGSLSE